MAYKDIHTQRRKDRERFRERSAERIAKGLCPKCGARPPLPERSLCEFCNDKRNRASRARDARLRAEGKPTRDPARAREYERGRTRRDREKWRAQGLCTRCGKASAVPDRVSCDPCLEKRREDDRARYARGRAAGLAYGGANADVKRRSARAKSRRRQKARREAGLCIRCGQHPPAEGGATCAPCRETRQAAERRQYTERRGAGLCVRCGGRAVEDLSRCAPCAVIEDRRRDPERKNGQTLKRYAERRAKGLCTSCGEPAQGASRCSPCAERSYHGSAYFRGMPVWDPSWTVIEIATGQEIGTFDSEADVSLCLAFAKLGRDQVEIVTDASPMSSIAAWT